MTEDKIVNVDFGSDKPQYAGDGTKIEYIDLSKPRKLQGHFKLKGPKFNEVGAEIEYMELAPPTPEQLAASKEEGPHHMVYEKIADPNIFATPQPYKPDTLSTKEILELWQKMAYNETKQDTSYDSPPRVESCKKAESCKKETCSNSTGMLVFNIDVGQLPVSRAEAFVERWKTSNKDALDALPKNIVKIFNMVRNFTNPTNIQYIKF
jgi:hypothetical protein